MAQSTIGEQSVNPTTDTSLVPSHMKRNPAHHGYRPRPQLRFISPTLICPINMRIRTLVALWEVSQKEEHEKQVDDYSSGSARNKALGCVFITNLLKLFQSTKRYAHLDHDR